MASIKRLCTALKPIVLLALGSGNLLHLPGRGHRLDHRAELGRQQDRGQSNRRPRPSAHGAANDRVSRAGESYMKDFKPLRLGVLTLNQGRGALALRAVRVPGKQVMEVRGVAVTLLK